MFCSALCFVVLPCNDQNKAKTVGEFRRMTVGNHASFRSMKFLRVLLPPTFVEIVCSHLNEIYTCRDMLPYKACTPVDK